MSTQAVTSRQVRNKQLRDMGIKAHESYQVAELNFGDKIQLVQVEQSPAFSERQFEAIVLRIDDHGWYLRVDIEHAEPGDRERERLTMMRDDPADWGVIECRILENGFEPRQPIPVKGGGDRRNYFYTPDGRMIL